MGLTGVNLGHVHLVPSHLARTLRPAEIDTGLGKPGLVESRPCASQALASSLSHPETTAILTSKRCMRRALQRTVAHRSGSCSSSTSERQGRGRSVLARWFSSSSSSISNMSGPNISSLTRSQWRWRSVRRCCASVHSSGRSPKSVERYPAIAWVAVEASKEGSDRPSCRPPDGSEPPWPWPWALPPWTDHIPAMTLRSAARSLGIWVSPRPIPSLPRRLSLRLSGVLAFGLAFGVTGTDWPVCGRITKRLPHRSQVFSLRPAA